MVFVLFLGILYDGNEKLGIFRNFHFYENKKKRMPGEQSSDDAPEISAAQHFKHVFFNMLDCARISIEERFCPNREILEDLSWLNPRKFNDIMTTKDFPAGVLSCISKLCNVERSILLIELKQFADQYKSFIKVVKTQALLL